MVFILFLSVCICVRALPAVTIPEGGGAGGDTCFKFTRFRESLLGLLNSDRPPRHPRPPPLARGASRRFRPEGGRDLARCPRRRRRRRRRRRTALCAQDAQRTLSAPLALSPLQKQDHLTGEEVTAATAGKSPLHKFGERSTSRRRRLRRTDPRHQQKQKQKQKQPHHRRSQQKMQTLPQTNLLLLLLLLPLLPPHLVGSSSHSDRKTPCV